MASIKLPDGSVKEVADGTTVGQIAEGIGRGLAKAAIVGKVDGKLVDLSHPLTGAHDLQIVTEKDADGLYVMRHSAAHVLAQALRHLYGAELQYTIGPVIDSGFFYDFLFPKDVAFSVDDLPKVEKEMQRIIDGNLAFSREDVEPEKAKEILHAQSQRFKDEIIDELKCAGEKSVSIYRQGDFTDLCRGPHIPSTAKIKSFKLQSVAGAYWRGDSNREQLTRIYGTAFFDMKELDNYLKMLEEAKKRDHRFVGPQLSLFHMQEDAPGSVFWHDKGWTLWRIVENYIRDAIRAQGYIEVRTPQLLDRSLWEKSGHWEKYQDLMFVTESEKHVFAVKPMNCPCHIQIFNQGTKSYRDLPLRMAEFGACHRNEPGGTLHGIMRVRAFTQDDAHIFCTEAQIESEVREFVGLLHKVYKDFGFDKVITKLSTRPEKRIGSDEMWDKTEKALADALQAMGMTYEVQPGEGAFYGPKLEFQISDALGRLWQLGTIQVDGNLPDRLNARYVGEDNSEHIPFMLHRAILGSMERFLGILIEHYAGAFPLWLAPVQVAVLTISEKFNDYGKEVADALTNAGLRAEGHFNSEKIGAKIRHATLQKIPYMLVLGEQERDAGKVAVRHRTEGDKGQMSLEEFIQRCDQAVSSRGVAPVGGTPA
ncbi:MAG TPA: threonine--tRNA ligase [Tepidisphaeraceae bacterium]|nr:threonine--tRNA ligase [Tepidisphaeraceae bacterium]